MFSLKNMKVASKLRLLVAVSIVGLLIVGGVSYWTISVVKVGGTLHSEMLLYSDLNADVLPPALDIERVRYGTLLMLADGKAKLAENVALFQGREKDYVDANESWKKRLPEGKLKDLLSVQAYEAGRRYMKIVDEEMVPAIERGDKKGTQEARARAVGEVEKCMAATKAAVEMVLAKQKELDAKGKTSVTTSLLALLGIGLLVGVAVAILGFTVARSVSSGTGSTLELANAIAAGQLNMEDMKVDGRDELAELMQALNQMKHSLKDRTALSERMAALSDKTSVNLMYADTDFTLQYMNAASVMTMRKLEKYLPVKPTEMIGKSIDIFHKNPERVRRMMADKVNMPYKALIEVGPEKIELTLDHVLDRENRHIGFIGTWQIVTETQRIEAMNADYTGQIEAIGKSQAVAEFSMDGNFVSANENFLKTMGYALEEIKGRHHSIFVDEATKHTAEYKEFWAKLNRGEYEAGEFKRLGKGGKEVWLRASYNPILDRSGKPSKVVKYALDVTAQVKMREEVARKAEQDHAAAEELKGKVGEILEVVAAAANGDLTGEISVKGTDAIGQMGEGLEAFLGDLRRSMASIGKTAQSLAKSSEEVTTQGQQMSANSEETSAQANVVAKATQQVNENLQSVATGAEEMTLTVRSIASNASEAARVAGEAVKTAHAANETVSKLGDSSAEIGQVIKVITSIAQQTNLLALNATIEAARAGEAGKGFAVVANEVKELAKQTAKATEDISQKITTIQHDTKGAVEAIGAISETINRINEISTTIATAVEEQSATTNEMSRNVAEAAKGSGEISQNIQGVAQAADGTASSAQGSQKSALELAEMAAQLRSLVDRFKLERDDDRHAGRKPMQARAASASR